MAAFATSPQFPTDISRGSQASPTADSTCEKCGGCGKVGFFGAAGMGLWNSTCPTCSGSGFVQAAREAGKASTISSVTRCESNDYDTTVDLDDLFQSVSEPVSREIRKKVSEEGAKAMSEVAELPSRELLRSEQIPVETLKEPTDMLQTGNLPTYDALAHNEKTSSEESSDDDDDNDMPQRDNLARGSDVSSKTWTSGEGDGLTPQSSGSQSPKELHFHRANSLKKALLRRRSRCDESGNVFESQPGVSCADASNLSTPRETFTSPQCKDMLRSVRAESFSVHSKPRTTTAPDRIRYLEPPAEEDNAANGHKALSLSFPGSLSASEKTKAEHDAGARDAKAGSVHFSATLAKNAVQHGVEEPKAVQDSQPNLSEDLIAARAELAAAVAKFRTHAEVELGQDVCLKDVEFREAEARQTDTRDDVAIPTSSSATSEAEDVKCSPARPQSGSDPDAAGFAGDQQNNPGENGEARIARGRSITSEDHLQEEAIRCQASWKHDSNNRDPGLLQMLQQGHDTEGRRANNGDASCVVSALAPTPSTSPEEEKQKAQYPLEPLKSTAATNHDAAMSNGSEHNYPGEKAEPHSMCTGSTSIGDVMQQSIAGVPQDIGALTAEANHDFRDQDFDPNRMLQENGDVEVVYGVSGHDIARAAPVALLTLPQEKKHVPHQPVTSPLPAGADPAVQVSIGSKQEDSYDKGDVMSPRVSSNLTEDTLRQRDEEPQVCSNQGSHAYFEGAQISQADCDTEARRAYNSDDVDCVASVPSLATVAEDPDTTDLEFKREHSMRRVRINSGATEYAEYDLQSGDEDPRPRRRRNPNSTDEKQGRSVRSGSTISEDDTLDMRRTGSTSSEEGIQRLAPFRCRISSTTTEADYQQRTDQLRARLQSDPNYSDLGLEHLFADNLNWETRRWRISSSCTEGDGGSRRSSISSEDGRSRVSSASSEGDCRMRDPFRYRISSTTTEADFRLRTEDFKERFLQDPHYQDVDLELMFEVLGEYAGPCDATTTATEDVTNDGGTERIKEESIPVEANLQAVVEATDEAYVTVPGSDHSLCVPPDVSIEETKQELTGEDSTPKMDASCQVNACNPEDSPSKMDASCQVNACNLESTPAIVDDSGEIVQSQLPGSPVQHSLVCRRKAHAAPKVSPVEVDANAKHGRKSPMRTQRPHSAQSSPSRILPQLPESKRALHDPNALVDPLFKELVKEMVSVDRIGVISVGKTKSAAVLARQAAPLPRCQSSISLSLLRLQRRLKQEAG